MADGNQPGMHALHASGKEKFGDAEWQCFDHYHNAAHRHQCKKDCIGRSCTMDPDVARIRETNKKWNSTPTVKKSSFVFMMSAAEIAKKSDLCFCDITPLSRQRLNF
jgi:hypothetical protein